MRKYRPMILGIAGILCLLLLTSCSFFTKKDAEQEPKEDVPTAQQIEEANLRQTVLYYQDDAGYLVPVMKMIPWEEGIGKAALSRLISTTENLTEAQEIGLKTLIPEGTEIDLSIKDGLAKANLSKEALECKDAIAETNMVSGIVDTLAEFPTVDKVQIMIEGKQTKKLTFGTDISKPFEKTDLNMETADKNVDIKNASKVTVFFENESDAYLVPVTRLTSKEANLDTALNELLKGPGEESKLISSFPEDCKLLSAEIADDVATVNFSKEFNTLAETPDKEKIVLKSIMLTCKQFPEVKDVKIQVDGSEYVPGDAANMTVPTFINEY